MTGCQVLVLAAPGSSRRQNTTLQTAVFQLSSATNPPEAKDTSNPRVQAALRASTPSSCTSTLSSYGLAKLGTSSVLPCR
jgi:hypothetical protein